MISPRYSRLLSASAVRLLLLSFLLVLFYRLALHLLPFRLLAREPRISPRRKADPQRLVWAIEAISNRLPGATCLVRALAARRLLARHGHPSTLHLGVAKSPAFEAHAWLDHGGVVILGAPESGYFTPLATL